MMLMIMMMIMMMMSRDDSSVSLSWYVNTNEDVADFRVELTSVTREHGPR